MYNPQKDSEYLCQGSGIFLIWVLTFLRSVGILHAKITRTEHIYNKKKRHKKTYKVTLKTLWSYCQVSPQTFPQPVRKHSHMFFNTFLIDF